MLHCVARTLVFPAELQFGLLDGNLLYAAAARSHVFEALQELGVLRESALELSSRRGIGMTNRQLPLVVKVRSEW